MDRSIEGEAIFPGGKNLPRKWLRWVALGTTVSKIGPALSTLSSEKRMATQTHEFQAEVKKLLDLMIHRHLERIQREVPFNDLLCID